MDSQPTTAPTTPGWALLAHVVRARRQRLGLNQNDITGDEGPSFSTIQTVERGNRAISRRNLAKLNDRLSWPPGTAECLVHAHIPDAVHRWDDFISISINDITDRENDTIPARLNRNQIHFWSERVEQINSYLLFADYHLTCLKTAKPDDQQHHISTLEDCIHDARSIVFEWLRAERKDTPDGAH